MKEDDILNLTSLVQNLQVLSTKDRMTVFNNLSNQLLLADIINNPDNDISELLDFFMLLFSYDEFGNLTYTNDTQAIATSILNEIAERTGTFADTIEKEKTNIKDDLTIIRDTKTGEEHELVDGSTIDERVRDVLEENTIFTCLKTLALCNKCAHSYDKKILSLGDIFKNYYSILYPGNSITDDITFFHPLNKSFLEVDVLARASLVHITSEQFEKIETSLGSISDIDFKTASGAFSYIKQYADIIKKAKIDILKDLNKIDSSLSYEDVCKKINDKKLSKMFKEIDDKDIDRDTKIKVLKSLNHNINYESMNDRELDKKFKDRVKDKQETRREKKISILESLGFKKGVDFDEKNIKEVDELIYNIASNKDKIIATFMKIKYEEGEKQAKLQNKLFNIKDEYISMIAQLLKTGAFKNNKYELVKQVPSETNNVKPGFEYMLVIDDQELSYYIEVHMPNELADALKKDYGYVEVEDEYRSTQRLGASAVYKRDSDEVEDIRKALKNNKVPQNGIVRAEIISRGGTPTSSGGESNEKVDDSIETSGGAIIIIDPNDINKYKFITEKIDYNPQEFVKYLKIKNMYNKDLEDINNIILNENYPAKFTKEIVYKKYIDIYDKLSVDDKNELLEYSFNEMKKGDLFDRYMYVFLKKNEDKCSVDDLEKTILYKNILKSDFVDNNLDNIKEMLYNSNNKNNLDSKFVLLADKYLKNYIRDNTIDLEEDDYKNDSKKSR